MPNSTTDAAPLQQAHTITYGRLSVDLVGFAVSVAARDVPLTYSEFLLFKTLLLRPTQAVTRGVLMAALEARQVAAKHGGAAPSPRTIDLHMSRLRRKLAQAGYDCIKTMRFVGYRFVPSPDVGNVTS